MLIEHEERFGLREALTRQGQVMLAVMLRNIRTRFFGHGLGYLVAIVWPLAHILILVGLFQFTGRGAPIGESAALFIATGVVPFLTFSYISRFMQNAMIGLRPLTAFPQVKVLDILFATALLEALSSCLVAIALLCIASYLDMPAMPHDIVEAAYAYGAAILLGVGFGLLNGVIAMAVPFWMTGYALIVIFLYITSGVALVPSSFPETVRNIAYYHPLLQTVEWMRTAYYSDYGSLVLDRAYVLEVGISSICLGLLLERGMRGHLLASR